MKTILAALAITAVVPFTGVFADSKTAAPPKSAPRQVLPPNPNIDMDAYVSSVKTAAEHRKSRRLTEEQFIAMAAEKGVIVLDARSKEKYDLLHIDGAINLNFSDITVASLKKTLPDKNARILIYCNNNFKNAEGPFPSKQPVASLNISTYITLYNYGYRNVYELAPRLDPAKSKLAFAGKQKAK
ncbi:MAG TPA: rhodanese-like domain-containing protein [Urbifossiella sp.]|nr:rhodanese-like domain-containing protein [Urbifossiella sp.]